ncbi:MAG: FtsX-like permease family protein [Pseudomonadales bacterium]|nr:FtsX-like permease family protein [Pseudomonadales bacterium]
MAESTALPGVAAGRDGRERAAPSSLQAAASLAILAVAWRNLGRNRKRTALTASAVGFASMLLVFAMSMQGGSYGAMVDNATRLVTGHLQIQDARFADDPKMRYFLADAEARVAALEADPRVRAASPRIQAFAVLSGAERSFGGQIMGVDPERERHFSLLPEFVGAGRWLSGERGELVLGTALARNLDVALGDEVVILGTAPDGSIAAAVATLVGLLATGQPEIDRSLAQMPIGDVREAFLLDDAAHAIVVTVADVRDADALAAPLLGIAAGAGGGDAVLRARPWRELIPELEQMIELDKASAYFFYVLLALMVTFSITNTFMMTVFERTREFGTLLAIGCRPGFVIALLQVESLLLCGLGVFGGTVLGLALTGGLMVVGIPLDEMGAELLRQYHMPERLYPTLSLEAVLSGPLFMLAATQIAALLPALRLRGLEPVAALRD